MSNVTILFRPNTEDEPLVRDLFYNYSHQTGRELHKISLDTLEGAEMAKLYGVVDYPAVVAKSNFGDMIRLWQGGQLPLIQEIAYYDQV